MMLSNVRPWRDRHSGNVPDDGRAPRASGVRTIQTRAPGINRGQLMMGAQLGVSPGVHPRPHLERYFQRALPRQGEASLFFKARDGQIDRLLPRFGCE